AYFLPLTRVIATSNAEQYHVVEITGAPNGSYIRERILSKLCIPDDSHSHFRIYKSQVGAYATSNELSDSTMFDLCMQHGDASGSLTFFVSTRPDRPPPKIEPDYSDSYLLSKPSQSRRHYARGS
ncbi:hypothetical protein BDZ89DRAFT_1062021, partial [Hymenopellis radicata]